MDLKKIFNLARIAPFQFDVDYLTKMDELFTCIVDKEYTRSVSSSEFVISSIASEAEPVHYICLSDKMVGDYFSSNKVLDS